MDRWHNLTIEEVFKALEVDRSGLSEEKATERRKEYGLNELQEKGKIPWPIVFLRQFASPSRNEGGNCL